jgi:hypothetical protein
LSDNVTILGNENILSMNKTEYTDGEWRHVLGLLAMCGRIREIYRLPLVPVAPETRRRLEEILRTHGVLAEPEAVAVAP